MRVKLNTAEIKVFKVLIIKSQAAVKSHIIITIAVWLCTYITAILLTSTKLCTQTTLLMNRIRCYHI